MPPDYKRAVFPGKTLKTWEALRWENVRDRIEAEVVWPISPWHPLQRRPWVGSRKKYERVQANRGARRRTNQILQSERVDEDWEGHLPGRRDYFDWWSVY